jgi:hypothetical protein
MNDQPTSAEIGDLFTYLLAEPPRLSSGQIEQAQSFLLSLLPKDSVVADRVSELSDHQIALAVSRLYRGGLHGFVADTSRGHRLTKRGTET